MEEVETADGKHIISRLEARIKDLELEIGEEKRKHAETIEILRQKEHQLKEVLIQCEKVQKNTALLQDSLEKRTQTQLTEQEGMGSPHPSVMRVRRFHRELEAAIDAAEAESKPLTLADICLCL